MFLNRKKKKKDGLQELVLELRNKVIRLEDRVNDVYNLLQSKAYVTQYKEELMKYPRASRKAILQNIDDNSFTKLEDALNLLRILHPEIK